ncbi:hypothetical protein KJB68_06635 [Mammaliicoccus sciuri]|nr:hypothetical protein [Mammaliicoccus sciuri]MCE5057837.1 hypothetical protein [Mammaliicoccus sciuri]
MGSTRKIEALYLSRLAKQDKYESLILQEEVTSNVGAVNVARLLKQAT